MISRAAISMAVCGAVALSWTDTHAQAPAPKKTPTSYEGSCSAAGCHDSYAKRKFQHGPAEGASCDACHEAVAGKPHAFKFVVEPAKLCAECHEPHEGKVRHKPYAADKCAICHDTHASDTKYLLKAASMAELCWTCHENFNEKLKFVHGPAAVGACSACHNSHASDHASLLRSDATKLCTSCHEAVGGRVTTAEHKHPPAVDDCTSCHSGHGANNRLSLKAAAPELCLDCHDDIGEAVTAGAVKHKAVSGEGSCGACHDPHGSAIGNLLKEQPMALCMKCHDKAIQSKDGKIEGLGKLLADNPDHHGPIRDKNCTACHEQVHGGSHFRLLGGTYPRKFYSPYDEANYDFCFKCHGADLVRAARSTTLTGFRNGDQNLHYLHVNRKDKGRTCRSCHATHASLKPKHITESVPFGSWDLPIEFEKTETGGGCSPGCHKAYRYDRKTPVVNIEP